MFDVFAQVAQEIHFLKSRTQPHGRNEQRLEQLCIAVAEYFQAHQTHHVGRAVDVIVHFRFAFVFLFLNVGFHAQEEILNEFIVDAIFLYGGLKGVEQRIQADSLLVGIVVIRFKFFKQILLVGIVKSIHNFISQTHKAVDTLDGTAGFCPEKCGSRVKRGAVLSGNFPA